MKSKNFKLIAASLAVALVLTITAVAETSGHHSFRGRGGDGMFGGPGFGFMAHYLDLTDAQKGQAKQIMTNEKTSLRPLMQQIRQNHAQERQLVEAANFDPAQAQAFAAQQSQTMTQLTVERLRMQSQIYQILTPDQKTKLNDFMDKRAQRFQQHQPQQQEQQSTQPSNQ